MTEDEFNKHVNAFFKNDLRNGLFIFVGGLILAFLMIFGVRVLDHYKIDISNWVAAIVIGLLLALFIVLRFLAGTKWKMLDVKCPHCGQNWRGDIDAYEISETGSCPYCRGQVIENYKVEQSN